MKFKWMNLILLFPIATGVFFLFVAISLPIINNVQTDATKDFCNQERMEYINNHYCADGKNAVEIQVKYNGRGFKKSDYEFYVVAK